MTTANPPGIVADSSAAALAAQLGEVWDSLVELGAGLSDQDWDLLTPCPGWSVTAQFAHMIGTESVLAGRPNPEVPVGEAAHVRNRIGEINEAWVVHLVTKPRSEVLELFAEVTSQRRRSLAGMSEEEFSAESWTPVGKADYRRFMQIRVFDCWVHEQDIRDAIGRPGHESGPAAEQALDEIVRAAGYLVGKKAAAPAGSSVRIALTGPLGRRVDVSVADGRAKVVEELPGEPTATLTLGSSAFVRLACGRLDPSAVLSEGRLGGVVLDGDRELGRRVIENLAFTI